MIRVKKFIQEGYHHIATVFFFIGFIFDSVNLPSPEEPLAKYLGIFYLVTLGLFLLLREYVVSRNTASKMEQNMYSFLTLGISLLSGAILSFVFIYYFRSAEILVSWPLFLAFVLIIFINEFISSHSFRFMLDLGVLMVSLIFFLVFNIPLFIHEQNDTIFVISVCIATLISFAYLYILSFSSEQAKVFTHKAYALAVGIPIVVMFLYFSNLIPAVPLSLKKADVYHSVVKKENGEFTAIAEPSNEKGLLSYFTRKEIHYTEGESIYFFSSVSAPSVLEAPLSHVWEYYDENQKTWILSTVIPFPLIGGREGGFRAYSNKDNVFPGLWRVSVKVGDRRVVGRLRFEVIPVTSPVEKMEVKL